MDQIESRYSEQGLSTRLDPYVVTVTSDLVRRYAGKVEDPSPWYAEASPLGVPVAHPGWLASLYLKPIIMKQSISGGVHAASANRFLRPVRVGQTITVHTQHVDRYLKRGRVHTVSDTTIVDEEGRLVLEGRNVGVSMFPVDPETLGRIRLVPEEPGPRVSGMAGAGRAIPGLTKTGRMILDPDGPKDYVSPHVEETARSIGLRGAIIGGVTTQAHVIEMLVGYFGECWFTRGQLSSKFVGGGVLEGDQLAVRAAILGADPGPEGEVLRLAVWVDNQEGRRVLVGTAACPSLA